MNREQVTKSERSPNAKTGIPDRAIDVAGGLDVCAKGFFDCALMLGLALALSGCAGYQLGSSNGLAAHGRSVEINPFTNQTIEPRLTDAVTSEMRVAVQRDGTYKLASHEDGDIVLSSRAISVSN